MLLPLLIAAVVGYLLGSLPFGYLVARARGVNIFEVGSKNPGATNVRRVLGSGPGNLVLFLDALKGEVAAALPLIWFWVREGSASTNGELVSIAAIDADVQEAADHQAGEREYGRDEKRHRWAGSG
jgi:glycerol-3-phosphate acyltransferase PlsY